MAGYLSPATFQTPNEWKARGPLGGFLAGMNQDIGNQIVDREMANDDINRQRQELALQEDKSLLPSKLAAAGLLESKSNYERGLYDDGTKAQEDAVRRGVEAEKLSAAKLKNEDDEREAAATLWVQMSEELKARGGQINFLDPDQREWYEDWHKKLGKYAPNMPAAAGPEDTARIMMQGQRAQQYLAGKAAGSINTAKHQQELEKAAVGPTISGQTNVKIAKINEDKSRAAEEMRADAKRDVAEIKAKTDRERAALLKTMDSLYIETVKRISKDGWQPQDVDIARDLARKKVMAVNKDTISLMNMKEGIKDPDSLGTAATDFVNRQADNELGVYKGFKEAAMARDAGIGITPSAGGLKVPEGAVQKLKANPSLAADFDAKYGPGASKQYLGK